jgi:hypothetical protein
LRTK